jgi:hypothetical protein
MPPVFTGGGRSKVSVSPEAAALDSGTDEHKNTLTSNDKIRTDFILLALLSHKKQNY